MLAHKATKEGEVVAEVIAGHKAAKDWVGDARRRSSPIPRSPRSGLGEEQAKAARASRSAIGKFPFAALGRAMAVNETDGFIKVVADKATHELLGVHIVGPEATDLISEGALALEMHAFLEDIGLTIHPHPTLGEGHDGGEHERARARDTHFESRGVGAPVSPTPASASAMRYDLVPCVRALSPPLR